MGFWIAVFTLPFIGGFFHFASAYGYHGKTRELARAEAVRVGIVLVPFSGFFAAAKLME